MESKFLLQRKSSTNRSHHVDFDSQWIHVGETPEKYEPFDVYIAIVFDLYSNLGYAEILDGDSTINFSLQEDVVRFHDVAGARFVLSHGQFSV